MVCAHKMIGALRFFHRGLDGPLFAVAPRNISPTRVRHIVDEVRMKTEREMRRVKDQYAGSGRPVPLTVRYITFDK